MLTEKDRGHTAHGSRGGNGPNGSGTDTHQAHPCQCAQCLNLYEHQKERDVLKKEERTGSAI